MTLTEFLLARIAEDEAEAWRWNADAGGGDWDSLETRVLAEFEAKRALLAIHALTDDGLCGACSDTYCVTPWDGLCEIAKPLAAIYADHPDYDEAWRP